MTIQTIVLYPGWVYNIYYKSVIYKHIGYQQGNNCRNQRQIATNENASEKGIVPDWWRWFFHAGSSWLI